MKVINATQPIKHNSIRANILAIGLGFSLLSIDAYSADASIPAYPSESAARLEAIMAANGGVLPAGTVIVTLEEAQLRMQNELVNAQKESVNANNQSKLAVLMAENDNVKAEASALGWAAITSEIKFQNADKSHLPTAPQDPVTHQYYLDLSSPDKAVSLPGEFGISHINLEAMLYRHQAAEMQLNMEKKISAFRGESPDSFKPLSGKNMTNSQVYFVYITGISSANYDNPETSVIEIDRTPGSTFNHGGAWVGAESQEVGAATSFGMTLCGVPGYFWSQGITYYNGSTVPMGMWRQMATSSGCQAGTIQSYATGGWGTYYSATVNFQ